MKPHSGTVSNRSRQAERRRRRCGCLREFRSDASGGFGPVADADSVAIASAKAGCWRVDLPFSVVAVALEREVQIRLDTQQQLFESFLYPAQSLLIVRFEAEHQRRRGIGGPDQAKAVVEIDAYAVDV